MSITDELRKATSEVKIVLPEDTFRLMEIADRIDKAHEDELITSNAKTDREAYQRGYTAACESLTPDGYIELPKDSQGEYIRPGDTVRKTHGGDQELYGVFSVIHNGEKWSLRISNNDMVKPQLLTIVKPGTIEQIYEDADLLIADYALNYSEPWGARSLGEMEAWKTRHLLDRLKAVLGGES